jgi:Arc/MetJ-type ribon-helix-helix transcriptional regulator
MKIFLSRILRSRSKRRRKMDEEIKNVPIPASLHRRIEEKIRGSNIPSVSSYVTKILREVLAKEEGEQALSKEDEEKVKERLRALGYLD